MTVHPKRINARQIKELLGILGDATLTRYIEEGLIPPPQRVGKSVFRARRYWWEHEVIEFLEKAVAENEKLDEARLTRRAEKQAQRERFLAAL